MKVAMTKHLQQQVLRIRSFAPTTVCPVGDEWLGEHALSAFFSISDGSLV